MKDFKIEYTEDCGATYQTMDVASENKTKAYMEAYTTLPLSAAITAISEV